MGRSLKNCGPFEFSGPPVLKSKQAASFVLFSDKLVPIFRSSDLSIYALPSNLSCVPKRTDFPHTTRSLIESAACGLCYWPYLILYLMQNFKSPAPWQLLYKSIAYRHLDVAISCKLHCVGYLRSVDGLQLGRCGGVAQQVPCTNTKNGELPIFLICSPLDHM